MKYSQLCLLQLATLTGAIALAPVAQASMATLMKIDVEESVNSSAPTEIEATSERSPGVNLAQALSADAHITSAADAAVTAPSAPTATTLMDLEAVATTIAPLTATAPQSVIQLVEPGTGNAWSPAQSASAFRGEREAIAQVIPTAETTTGWYVSLAPEVVFGYDIDTDGGNVAVPVIPAPGLPPVGTTTVPLDASLDTDTGFGFGGAVGYRFDNARVEFEVGYYNNNVDNIVVNDIEASADGDIGNWKFLINGYYDFPTDSRFSPYVGGGAGLAILSANDVSASLPPFGAVSIDDSNSSFIFQFKAGAGYDITDELTAFLGYRLMGIPGQSFEVLGTDLDADTLFIHSLQLGARYEF
ncbi:outer membrane protein [Halomicronema sp. CCY15110]|uniref:outer membrane protein n=1 Tax=Halomicronema sp. CCY15110 TaxID=2767773 RepID=UPI00194FD77B|nr:outer membrane beta-barrel protein [Halomicronema sp. CCY15110]